MKHRRENDNIQKLKLYLMSNVSVIKNDHTIV